MVLHRPIETTSFIKQVDHFRVGLLFIRRGSLYYYLRSPVLRGKICHNFRPYRGDYGRHSYLSAVIGSTLVARRAGI
jgi:hypothetical protein